MTYNYSYSNNYSVQFPEIPYECRDYERIMAPLDWVPLVSNVSGVVRIAMGVAMLAFSLFFLTAAVAVEAFTCGCVKLLKWDLELMSYSLYNLFIGTIDQIPIAGNLIAFTIFQNIKHKLNGPVPNMKVSFLCF